MRALNVPLRHSSSPDLFRYMEHVVDNAQVYSKDKKAILMGRTKLGNQRYRSFNNLVDIIKNMIGSTRNWIQERTGKFGTPFISVGHDGWDSKSFDMLGVCIHFTDVVNGKKCTFAVGLQPLVSKKSVDIAKHVHSMLKRYVYTFHLDFILFPRLLVKSYTTFISV